MMRELRSARRKIFEFGLKILQGSIPDGIYEKLNSRALASMRSLESDDIVNAFTDWSFLENLSLKTAISIKPKESPADLYYSLVLYHHAKLTATNSVEPLTFLETGTAKGFTATMMARAVKSEEKDCQIFTIDLIPHDMKMHWNCWGDSKLGRRSRREILSEFAQYLETIHFLEGRTDRVLESLQIPRVHLAFLDALHEYDALALEFGYVAERQLRGDVVILDDVDQSKFPGVADFVREIEFVGDYSVQMLSSPIGNQIAVATKR